MTACLCGLTLSLLSALGSDLGTTASFTARGEREVNPLARPFVQGASGHGEFALGLLTAGAYLAVDRTAPEPWRSLTMAGAIAIHTTLAIRNARFGASTETPAILLPVLLITW